MPSDSSLGLSAEWLKRVFLFGVDLTDDEGKSYPDEMFELAIEQAIEILETELNIRITAQTIHEELHDIVAGDWRRNYQFQTHFGPLRRITKVRFQHGNFPGFEVPLSWVHVRNAAIGLVDIIPGQGTITHSRDFSYGAASFGFDFLGWHIDTRRPGYLRVSYEAGFDSDSPLPAALKMAVGHLAAMLPLDTAGDLIAGAGIASYSTSLDGMSESVSTTASSTSSGYRARIISYQDQFKMNMAALKKRYLGPMFAVL